MEKFGKSKDTKELLKLLIRKLHEGADPETLKAEFKDAIGHAEASEIARVEEELIREGVSREDIHRLCDVHLSIFREALERVRATPPPGHPIHILQEEHRLISELVSEHNSIVKRLVKVEDPKVADEEIMRLKDIEEKLKSEESHYLREENILFPHLEKHGITEPPAIMWMEHDKIRDLKKNLQKIHAERQSMTFQDFKDNLEKISNSILETVTNHFYKENNILFPTALRVIGEDEWVNIRSQFDELGYCSFTPEPAKMAMTLSKKVVSEVVPGKVAFETGELSIEEIESILNTLPVDITFVDKEDTVRYYSQKKDRIFVRTKAVLGRKVQQCHPQKSLHAVNKILEEFRKGLRDSADFWIRLEDRFIYIRYFPVRGKDGEYLGCLEVTQDITDIKGLEGEKRLLG
ncbi:MAG: DUF438 domain-containing protein [Candidatus Bathyarchaeia archaeon]|nr:DUF438 domain-containing protein [Candidatus Bathyarchaeota archaeon]